LLSLEYYGIMCAVPCGETEYPQERNENLKRKATKMNAIKVTTKAQLDALYDDWSLTVEGLDPAEKNLKELLDWVKEFTPLKREDVYVIAGAVMNREYGLTGTNAYPDENCTLVCVKLADMERPNAVAVPRFQIGGRWFTDIVDNNARREETRRTGTEG